jgi:hypothetical protein
LILGERHCPRIAAIASEKEILMFRFRGFCLVLITVCASYRVATGVTLDSISISTSRGWENNIPESDPYKLEIELMTSDPTVKAIRVSTPAGSIIPTLDLDMPNIGDWHYSSPVRYTTLSDLQAQYKTGTWNVQFLGDGNAVIDSVSLTYDPVAPTGVPNITYPAIDATNVPLTPTFAWDHIVGTSNVLSMDLQLTNGEDAYDTLMDPSSTQWTPVQLDPLTEYQFTIGNYVGDGISLVNGQPQGPVLSTDQGGSFIYLAASGNEDSISFTTVPEPNTLSLLILGGITLTCGRFWGMKRQTEFPLL